MSHIYLVGIGWGLTFGDLTPFIQQPRCRRGVIAAQRDYSSDGSVREAGLHAVLEWNAITVPNGLQLLLEQCELESNHRRQVTLWLPDHERISRLYQGWLVRPQSIEYQFFPTGLTMTFNRAQVIG